MTNRILRYAKLGPEDEYGSDTLPPVRATVDIASASLDVPEDTMAEYEGGIGRAPRLHRPGWYAPEGNIEWAADVDTLGWALRWVLGGYLFTDGGGDDGHHLHEFYGSTSTELPSFAAWLGKDVFEHVFRGCVASSLQLEVSDGYAMLQLGVVAAKDEKGTIDEEVLASLPQPPPLTFPNVRFWVGGHDSADEVSAAIRSLTLEIDNNTDADGARGLGSRFAQRTPPAEQRATTVQFTSHYSGTDHIERVWGSSDGPSEDGSTELPLHLEAQVGDYGRLHVQLPRVVFSSVDTEPSGRDRIEQQVTATALLDDVQLDDDSTVESELLARLHNDQDEYAYAAE